MFKNRWSQVFLLVFGFIGGYFFNDFLTMREESYVKEILSEEAEKIPTMEIVYEVTERSGDTYLALQPLEDRQLHKDTIGLEFSQDEIWANEELELGARIEGVFNSDTGELIYVRRK